MENYFEKNHINERKWMHRSENKNFLKMSTLLISICKIYIPIMYEDTQ